MSSWHRVIVVVVAVVAASVVPRADDPAGLLPLPRPRGRSARLHRGRRPVEDDRPRRRARTAHRTPGPGNQRGAVARRQVGRLHRHLRRPRGGLCPAARRRSAQAAHMGRRPSDGGLVDARRQGVVHHPAVLHAAQRQPDRDRSGQRRADGRAAGAGQRWHLRGRRHAVLHATAVPGQPHASLQGRHRAATLAVCARRSGGRAHDGGFFRARASGR